MSYERLVTIVAICAAVCVAGVIISTVGIIIADGGYVIVGMAMFGIGAIVAVPLMVFTHLEWVREKLPPQID